MNNNTERCKKLHKLHANLVKEINILKESLREEEYEGVQNPVETANIIKHLQETLNSVTLELQKCPPEDS